MLRKGGLGAAVTLSCFLQGVAAQYDSCTTGGVANIGNGQCDAALNVRACGYDGGDCCSCTCVDSDEHSCGDSVFNCLYPGCDDATASSTEETTCVEEELGDGGCDSSQNSAFCGYDGGDVSVSRCACLSAWVLGAVGSLSVGDNVDGTLCCDGYRSQTILMLWERYKGWAR